MGENGDIVGMVDVLKLTYATLDQVNQNQNSPHNALLNQSRSTLCQQEIAKVPRGTNSGCLWKTIPNP